MKGVNTGYPQDHPWQFQSKPLKTSKKCALLAVWLLKCWK
jgi:hypothetical protein